MEKSKKLLAITICVAILVIVIIALASGMAKGAMTRSDETIARVDKKIEMAMKNRR